MKIHILSTLRSGPWGGGNQFLKSLRGEFIKKNHYTQDPNEADIILFNSFPFGETSRWLEAYRLKRKGKILIHRIDGPISQIRGTKSGLKVDQMIYEFNKNFVDGTIFQSNWSRAENKRLGIKTQESEAIILNAPDPSIFYRDPISPKKSRIRLIATSWSKNMRKGFEIYKYLDENLDFNRYEMTFIGNSPIEFKNIRSFGPMDSKAIAQRLREHQLFITASQVDPCSNALIEALHCGLPAVALEDGGHPEIIKEAGVLFHGKEDVLQAIEKAGNQYEHLKKQINIPNLEKVAASYYSFMEGIYSNKKRKTQAQPFKIIKLLAHNYHWLIFTSIENWAKRFTKK